MFNNFTPRLDHPMQWFFFTESDSPKILAMRKKVITDANQREYVVISCDSEVSITNPNVQGMEMSGGIDMNRLPVVRYFPHYPGSVGRNIHVSF